MHFEGEALTLPWLFIFPLFHTVYIGVESEVHLLLRNKEHRCFKVIKQVIRLIFKLLPVFLSVSSIAMNPPMSRAYPFLWLSDVFPHTGLQGDKA